MSDQNKQQATIALNFQNVTTGSGSGQKQTASMVGLDVEQQGDQVVFSYRIAVPVTAFASRAALASYVVVPENSKGGRGFIRVNPDTLQARQVRIGDADIQFSPTRTTGISVKPK